MPQCYLIDLLRTKEIKSNPTSQPASFPPFKCPPSNTNNSIPVLHHSTASSSIITSISAAAPSAKSIASWPITLRTYSPVHHAKPLLLLLLRHTRRIRSSAIDNHYYSSPPPPTTHFRCGSVRRKQRVPRQATANISRLTHHHPRSHPSVQYTSTRITAAAAHNKWWTTTKKSLCYTHPRHKPQYYSSPPPNRIPDRQTDGRTDGLTSDHQEDHHQ